jgi:hypothetical protein
VCPEHCLLRDVLGVLAVAQNAHRDPEGENGRLVEDLSGIAGRLEVHGPFGRSLRAHVGDLVE